MRSILSSSALFMSASLAVLACSDPMPGPPMGSGGAGSGGAGSGGAPVGTGGASATGGVASTGGAGSGGAPATGGASSGGASTGGSTSSGGSSSGGDTSSGGAGTGGGSSGEFTLTSAGLEEGAAFAADNTCAVSDGSGTFGFGKALPFEWSGAPEGTTAYAMVMLDDTLVGDGDRLGYHSAFWNLPATVTSLPAEFDTADLSGASVINGGYLGPCPGGAPAHTYTFTLYALDEDITLSTGAFGQLQSAQEFVAALEAAAIGTATLSGTSDAVNSP